MWGSHRGRKSYEAPLWNISLYHSSFFIFPTHKVHGRAPGPSTTQCLRGELTILPQIDIEAFQGKKILNERSKEWRQRNCCHLEKGLWMLDNHTHRNLQFFFFLKSWICLFRGSYKDGRRYRWEYLGASDSLKHIRTGWISKLQCYNGSYMLESSSPGYFKSGKTTKIYRPQGIFQFCLYAVAFRVRPSASLPATGPCHADHQVKNRTSRVGRPLWW